MQSNSPHDPQKMDTNKRVIAAALGLGSFGLFYSQVIVNRAERSGLIEGRSSLFVAFGTAVTLIIRQIMPAGLFYDLLAFVFSGVPMIANQLINQHNFRAEYKRRLQREESAWHVKRSNGRVTETR